MNEKKSFSDSDINSGKLIRSFRRGVLLQNFLKLESGHFVKASLLYKAKAICGLSTSLNGLGAVVVVV